MTSFNVNFSKDEAQKYLTALGYKMTGTEEHKNALRSRLDDMYEPKKKKSAIVFALPVSAVVLCTIIALIVIPRRPPIYLEDVMESNTSDIADVSSMTESSGIATSELLADRPANTAYEDQKNTHDTYGDLLEITDNITILHHENICTDIENLFKSTGGVLTRVSSGYWKNGSCSISGRIPGKSLETFKQQVEARVGSKYFRSNYRATSLNYQITSADKRIDNLKSQIEEAEVIIAQNAANTTSNEYLHAVAEKSRLEAELLAEENAKSAIIKRTETVSVSIWLAIIPKWYEATNHNDIKQAISGVNSPTFGQEILIGSMLGFKLTIIALCYISWLIVPVVAWVVWRRIRWRKLEQEWARI